MGLHAICEQIGSRLVIGGLNDRKDLPGGAHHGFLPQDQLRNLTAIQESLVGASGKVCYQG